MYKREFDKFLAEKKSFNSVMLFGAAAYLVEKYGDRVLKNAKDEGDYLQLYFDEYSFEEAKGFLSQNSLFGGKLSLRVKTDEKGKIKKDELKSLIELAHKNDALFVYEVLEDIRQKEYYQVFGEKVCGQFVRFFEPPMYEAVQILKEEADAVGVDISATLIEELLTLANNDLGLAHAELSKLLIFGRKIEPVDISKMSEKSADVQVQELIDEVVSGKGGLLTLEYLLEKGESEVTLLSSLENFFAKLFLCRCHIKLNGSLIINDMDTILGYTPPKHVFDKYQAMAKRFDERTLQKALELLMQAEFAVKTVKTGERGSVDRTLPLYGALLKLQKIF